MTVPSELPAISVILPVKNGEKYIVGAVESIISQTLRDWELILIDDGSSDNTPQIVECLASKELRIRPLRCREGGLVSALNTGLDLARGEFIARMDADDIAQRERFQKQLTVIKRREELVALGGQVRRIDGRGNELGDGHYPVGTTANRKQLRYSCPICHPAVMMRTDTVKQAGGYRRAYRHAEDYDLWLRMSYFGEIDNLDQIVLYYRIHDESVTAQNLHTQAMNSALARLAADARERGDADPTPAEGWRCETIEQALDILGVDEPGRMRSILSYWRSLVLSSGLRNTDTLFAFRDRLAELATYAAMVGETETFASLSLRAAYLAGKANSPIMAAQCFGWSVSASPSKAALEVAGRMAARLRFA